MKKNLTKKLMLSVLTLAFAVVSLGASTFAWFTFSNSAVVEPFTGTVKAAEGIQIAVTPEGVTDLSKVEWYSGVLPNKVIQEAAGKVTFNALTTNDGLAFFALDSLTGTASATPTKEGYLAVNIWIKSAEKGTLSVDDVNILNASEPTAFNVDHTFKLAAKTESDQAQTAEAGKDWKFKVADAARVALFLGAAQNDSANKQVYQADKAAVADGYAGNDLGYSEDGAFAYYNAKTEKDLTAPTETLTAIEAKDAAAEGKILTYDFAAAGTVCLSVYVWIEGWDGECLNAIFSQGLNVDLALSFAPETTE